MPLLGSLSESDDVIEVVSAMEPPRITITLVGARGVGKKKFTSTWVATSKTSTRKASDHIHLTVAENTYAIELLVVEPFNETNTFDNITELKATDGYIFMFSLSDKHSYVEAIDTYERLRDAYELTTEKKSPRVSPRETPPFSTMFVGTTKKDTTPILETKTVLKYADTESVQYFEVANSDVDSIHAVVEEIVKLVISARRKKLVQHVAKSVQLRKHRGFFSSASNTSTDDDDIFLKKFEAMSTNKSPR